MKLGQARADQQRFSKYFGRIIRVISPFFYLQKVSIFVSPIRQNDFQ